VIDPYEGDWSMLLQFMMQGHEAAGSTTLTIDTGQRKLVKGETYAFKDPDGDHFLARITSVTAAKRIVVERDGCEIIGRVVSWSPTLH
jgi:hypothetical protein